MLAKMVTLGSDELDNCDDCSFSSNEYKPHDQDNFLHLNIARTTTDEDDSYFEDLEISATFRHVHQCKTENITYSISDGGADSCVLGKDAYVINQTGRFARLIGYDDKNTRSGRVPIVSAYIKTVTDKGEYVLLLIHEAASLAHSSITLLSEFQLRQYGLIIDSVSKTHVLSKNPPLLGTQRIYLPNGMEIDLNNRGGIMAIPQFTYQPGDNEILKIIEITSKERWIPQRYRKEFRLTDNDSISTIDSDISALKLPNDCAAAAAHIKIEPDFRSGRV